MSGSFAAQNLFYDENQVLRYGADGPGSLINFGAEGAQIMSAPPGLAGDEAYCNGWLTFDAEGCGYLNQPLFLSGPPTLGTHAVTKDYVDMAALPITGGMLKGPLTIGDPAISNALTITPGPTAAAPVTMATSGAGGLQFNVVQGVTPLLISSASSMPTAAQSGGGNVMLQIIGKDATDTSIIIDSFGKAGGGAGGGFFQFRHANGTPAALTATQFAARTGGFRAGGYGTTGYTAETASLNAYSAEAYTDTAQGSFMTFCTTKIGTTGGFGAIERMRITDAGAVRIGLAPNNMVTITPGATATDPTVLAPSGAGGLQITGGTDARSLAINHSGGIIPVIASSVTNALQFAGAANESTGIGVLTFGTGNPTFSGVHAGGTLAAAAATPINSVLFAITGSGHDGTQYITPSRAQIQIAAAELWSATANGTDIRFLTTAATTLTRTEKLRLTSTGSLLLGVTGTNNTLTVTPGAAAANPVVLGLSGTAGIQIGSGTQNIVTITPGANVVVPPTFTASSGSISLPGITATSLTVSNGGSAIQFSGGATTTDPVTISSGQLVPLNISFTSLFLGGGTRNSLTITTGAAAANPVALTVSGAGGLSLPGLVLLMPSLPTSAAGLVAGQVWRNGNIVTIV